MFTQLNALDWQIFYLINHQATSPIFDAFMFMASSALIWFALGCIVIAGLLLTKKIALTTVCSILVTIIISDLCCFRLLKPAFARLRPCYQSEDVLQRAERCGSDFGFPSNHAANAMAVAMLFWIKKRISVLSIVTFLMALLVGFSRIHLGVHFPGDVLGGFFFAIFFGFFGSLITDRIALLLQRKFCGCTQLKSSE